MRPVVVVGDLMVDVVVRMEAELAHGSDTPARVRTRPGGAGANVAAWLAVAGAPVTLVARAGDDDAGRRAVDLLRGHGVSAAVALDDTRPTGTCVVLVHPGGERSMLPDTRRERRPLPRRPARVRVRRWRPPAPDRLPAAARRRARRHRA